MTQAEFGERVMRWGRSSEQARQRIGSLTRAELEQAGVMRAMAAAWYDFYVNEAGRNPSNPSAAGRADLMRRAMELLSRDG
jgi:hypothetical protein